MALKVIEGFDNYRTAESLLQRSGYLQWIKVPLNVVSFEQGRYQGQSIRLFLYTTLEASLADNLHGGVLGFSFKTDSVQPQNINLYFHDSQAPGNEYGFGGQNAQFSVTLSGQLGAVIYPGGQTASNLFPAGAWAHVEIAWTVSRNAGTLRVRVNEEKVVDLVGINTQAFSPNSWVNYLQILAAGGIFSNIDDMYICDDTIGPGTNPCNDFLGNRRVVTLLPTSNVQTGWSASKDTNWSALNTGNSYNSAMTVGVEDIFKFDDLPSNVSNIAGIQVNGSYQNTDAGGNRLTQHVVSGGSDAQGTNPLSPYGLSSTKVTYSDLFPINPATGDQWQPDALRNGKLQAGYKLES